ncbi:Protein disulfide isomerase-like 2-1 [Durusdinium trenchii]|uniref:Protein disulfide isomerase-like 2-1 n=1 Tax=Durusdinium trenchii TaxID=1381693 RepID=A0ABP0L0J3_9DINO
MADLSLEGVGDVEEECYRNLTSGSRVLLWYSDDHVWHEALIGLVLGGEQVVMYTPDKDLYIESIGCKGLEGPIRLRGLKPDLGLPSRLRAPAYRFREIISDTLIKQVFRDSVKLAEREAGCSVALPTHILNHAGQRKTLEEFFGGSFVRSRQPTPIGKLDKSSDSPKNAVKVQPALGDFVWLAAEPLGGLILGQEVSLNSETGVQVGTSCALALRKGVWVKVDMVKLSEVEGYADRRRALFGVSSAAGSGECPQPGKGGSNDVRTLWVDFDEHGDRYKRWRDVCKESYTPSFDQTPLEGPTTGLHLIKHAERHGGDPRLWMQLWCRSKHIETTDRTFHEMKVLVDALFFAGTFDQVNIPALMSMEVVCRRIQAIVDAYSNPSRPSWENAKIFAGQGTPEDIVSPTFRNYATRKNKEELELLQARQKVRELRGAPAIAQEEGDAAESLPTKVAREGRGRLMVEDSRQVTLEPSEMLPDDQYRQEAMTQPGAAAAFSFKQRRLFPLPLFACPPRKLGTSRSVRQRRDRICRAFDNCNEVVRALNWLAGESEPQSSDFTVSAMQQQVLSRVEGLVFSQKPSGDEIMKPEEALKVLLRGGSPYDMGVINDAVASYQSELVSVPQDCRGCPDLRDVLPTDDRQYLEENSELMLRPKEDRPEHPVQPYWDPKLRYNRKAYHGLVRKLNDIGYFTYTLAPLSKVGVFFVWKSNRTKLRLITDCRPTNEIFREAPGVSLTTAEGFGRIEVELEDDCWGDYKLLSAVTTYVGLSDVRDCFHRMRVPAWLSRYFAWESVPASVLNLEGTTLEGKLLGPRDAVFPCAGSLCQGFSWSLYFAQRANENVCRSVDTLQQAVLTQDRGGPVVLRLGKEQADNTHFYVYVDNLGVLDTDAANVELAMQGLQQHFNSLGLELHASEEALDAVTLGGRRQWSPRLGEFKNGLGSRDQPGIVLEKHPSHSKMGPKRTRSLTSDSSHVTNKHTQLQRKRTRTLSLGRDALEATPTDKKRVRCLDMETFWQNRLKEKKVKGLTLPLTESALQKLSSLEPRRQREDKEELETETSSTMSELKEEPKGKKKRSLEKRPRKPLQHLVDAQLGTGMSFLEAAAITKRVRERYNRSLSALMTFLQSNGFNFSVDQQVDTGLVKYFEMKFTEGEGSHVGDYALAALLDRHPEFGKNGFRKIPHAWRALKGWRKLCPSRSRLAYPLPLWCGIAWRMIARGHLQKGVFNLLQLSTYHRPSTLLKLKKMGLVPPTSGVTGTWSILTSLTETSDISKTGTKDDAVLLDSPFLDFIEPVLRRLAKGPPLAPVWTFTYPEYLEVFNQCAKDLKDSRGDSQARKLGKPEECRQSVFCEKSYSASITPTFHSQVGSEGSYMHRFFRSFELCSLAVPTAPELSFVSALVTRQDAEEERHCKRVLCHFESFVKSWKRFYRENEGRLPVECQAGRAALGMETQDSLLEAIDDEDDGTKLPLRFFVNGDEKCQSQVVAEYLCSLWNEMIAAAAAVLRESGGNCELWAGRMERSIPLGLADLLFQDQITEALKSNAFLRRSILRHLRGARGVIAPLVDWTAVQQEILSSAWVHRVQKLDLPPFSRFWPRPETKAVSFDSTAPLDAEVEERKEGKDRKGMERERVMEFLAQLPLVELQSCREEIARISLHVGDADPRKLVLEMEEISQLRAVLPEQVTALLRGIRENGEFSHLSKVFMAAPPTEIDLTASLARHFRIRTEATRTVHELAGRDADLRETITNLEESGFCAHLLTSPNTPLLEVYQAVFQCEGVLSQLPCQILGCHLVAVLQSLRVLLRKVRARKCALDRCTCWNPREGIQALSSWAEDESRGSEEVTNAAEDVAIVTLAPETMLPWVCWACGTEEIPRDPLEAERKLSKLLDLFEKQVNEFGLLVSVPRPRHGFLGPGTVKNSSWQSSLSVKVAHLRTLLDYKDSNAVEKSWMKSSGVLHPQDLDFRVIVPSETNPTDRPTVAGRSKHRDCALRGAWRRFVGGFAAHASEELEEAVRRVVELPLIVSIIKDAEKYTLEGSKVLLRYKNHYYQLDLIPEPQAEAADAGWIGFRSYCKIGKKQVLSIAIWVDVAHVSEVYRETYLVSAVGGTAEGKAEDRSCRKRLAEKPIQQLEEESGGRNEGDEATNELTKIEEDGEEDEDSWDIV